MQFPFSLTVKTATEQRDYINQVTPMVLNKPFDLQNKSNAPIAQGFVSNIDAFKPETDNDVDTLYMNAAMLIALKSIKGLYTSIDPLQAAPTHERNGIITVTLLTSHPVLVASAFNIQGNYTIGEAQEAIMFYVSDINVMLKWLHKALEDANQYNYFYNPEVVLLEGELHLARHIDQQLVYECNTVNLNAFIHMYKIDITSFSAEVYDRAAKGVSHPIYVKGTYVYGLSSVLYAFMRGDEHLHVKFIKTK